MSKHWTKAERIVALALIAWGLTHFAIFVMKMATTSLWIDEIMSVHYFASQGLATTLTEYPEPNNHIFFNVLQSFYVGEEAYRDPASARILSIAATFLGILATMGILWRQKLYFEAGLATLLMGSSVVLMSILCQARGYGLQFLLITGLAYLLWSDEQRRNPRNLWIAGVLLVMSIWTAPSILLVIAPFGLLSIALTKPRKPIFLFWVGSAVATFIVYIPVLAQLIHVYTHFNGDHGKVFLGWHSVGIVGAHFLDQSAALAVVIGLPLTIAAGYLVRKKNLAPLLWLIAFTFAVAVSWIASNPPARVLSPMTGVLWASALTGLGMLVRKLERPLAQTSIAVVGVVSTFLFIPFTFKLDNYHYVPMENWLGTTKYIERTFPKGTQIWTTTTPGTYLQLHLADGYRVVDDFDEASYQLGNLIVVDTKLPPKRPLPKKSIEHSILVSFGQHRGTPMQVYSAIPQPLPTALPPEHPKLSLKIADPTRPVHTLLHAGNTPLLHEAFIIETNRLLTPVSEDMVQRYEHLEILLVDRPIIGLSLKRELADSPVFAYYAQEKTGP